MYINVIIPIRLLLDKGDQVDGKDKEGIFYCSTTIVHIIYH